MNETIKRSSDLTSDVASTDYSFPLSQNTGLSGKRFRTVFMSNALMEMMSHLLCSTSNSCIFSPSTDLLLSSIYSGVWCFCPTDRENAVCATNVSDLVGAALSCGQASFETHQPFDVKSVGLLEVNASFSILKAVREILQRCSVPGQSVEFGDLPSDYFYQSEDFCPQLIAGIYEKQIDRALKGQDVLLLPGLAELPLGLQQAQGGKVAAQDRIFISPIYLSGHPIISMPIPPVQGRPMSVFLVGKKGQDAALLSFAQRLDARMMASF